MDRAASPARRRLLATALLMAAWGPAARAAGRRQIGWHELVPAGWDPQQGLRELPTDIDDLQDTDPRAQVHLRRLREIWDRAPVVGALEGAEVRLPGYIVPIVADKRGVSEFLLVPFLGACIHSPPPPANQIVLCRADGPLPGLRVMEAVWTEGRLSVQRADTPHGAAGYAMQVASAVKQL